MEVDTACPRTLGEDADPTGHLPEWEERVLGQPQAPRVDVGVPDSGESPRPQRGGGAASRAEGAACARGRVGTAGEELPVLQ